MWVINNRLPWQVFKIKILINQGLALGCLGYLCAKFRACSELMLSVWITKAADIFFDVFVGIKKTSRKFVLRGGVEALGAMGNGHDGCHHHCLLWRCFSLIQGDAGGYSFLLYTNCSRANRWKILQYLATSRLIMRGLCRGYTFEILGR